MKKKYRIVFTGEGRCEGIIELIDEEYDVLSHYLCVRNWTEVYDEPYSPNWWIEPIDE